MTFAASKGMNVARVQLHRGRVNTLLVERFDRVPADDGHFYRIPMLSGLTLLDSDWNNPLGWAHEWHYGLLVDEMNRRGVPLSDLQELFKRICFNILVGNDDDHPKNVAVLYLNGSWRLSPMYDVLPTTEGDAPTSLAMGVGSFGKELSRRNLLSQVGHYGLSHTQAESIIDEVAGWEPELAAHYRQHLQRAELELALAAIGADKLRA
jgi:serine/threonine-protein kinase HipA